MRSAQSMTSLGTICAHHHFAWVLLLTKDGETLLLALQLLAQQSWLSCTPWNVLKSLSPTGILCFQSDTLLFVTTLSKMQSNATVHQASNQSNFWGWVINLDHRKDRWEHMVNQAEAQDVSLVRHPAVNPGAGDPVPEEVCVTQWETTLNSKFDHAYKPGCVLKMSNGERGCAMSHIQLWQKVCSRSNPVAHVHATAS